MTKMKLALAFCGLMIGGAAVAAPRFDRNGDGTVDAQEKAAAREQFKQHRAEMKQKMLQKFDANRDGKLDDGERAAMRETFQIEAFKKLDTDGNGQLSLQEFKQGKRFMKHHRGGGHGGARRGWMKARQ
jgi:Ca2+-binding EF-hand superfamily protein